jgi:F-type H+/Na+-transporting ATPase subunit alpha
LRKELGGGSLTALPIIETEAQNISAYIPTNLISITDGQIYLSPSLFELGVLPAVDVGKSVSRVGGKAQRAAYRAVAGDLKLAYAQFEELETFARFGARLDEDTRKVIAHGRRIRACLKQPEFAPVSMPAQITVLLALTADLFDDVPLDRMTDAEQAVRKAAAEIPAEVSERLDIADTVERCGSRNDHRNRPPSARSPRKESFEPEPEQEPQKQPKPETKPQTKPDNPRGHPGSRHERHHGEPAPKNRQCRKSAVGRPHDEGLAASSIGQYEQSVRALGDYYHTVELGLGVCFRDAGSAALITGETKRTAGCDRRGRVRLRPGAGGPV